MQFATVTREVAEKAFTIIRNRQGATLTQHLPVCYDMTTSFDGLYAIIGATTDLKCMAGIADENIADNDYGRVQNWGYRASMAYTAAASSVTFTKGDWMGPVNGGQGLTSQAVSPQGVVAGETKTISAAGYFQGFIRCL